MSDLAMMHTLRVNNLILPIYVPSTDHKSLPRKGTRGHPLTFIELLEIAEIKL